MTEDQIERRVEHMFDELDGRFTRGEIDQHSYDSGTKAIDAWADRQYRLEGVS